MECKSQAKGMSLGKHRTMQNHKVLRSFRNIFSIVPSKTQDDTLQVHLFKIYLVLKNESFVAFYLINLQKKSSNGKVLQFLYYNWKSSETSKTILNY